ncbi:hypothetical protein MUB18_15625 [Sphingobacterium sp. PCS056]|uniref:hypothetical protein n=1 Tax=Sphingobacterium sp. PCS056 TaxID=2931400 RepID=UPI00200DFEF7|nr:hypothetical protein [Sphingobacterium sp. PCS056]UPZ35533.1 hypothetical protein MUB18_15625 [Sphingobacterium sp. PCS056]
MTQEIKYRETDVRNFIDTLNTYAKINKRKVSQSLQITKTDISQWSDIIINNCIFEDEVILKEIKIKHSIRFFNCNFLKRFNLSNLTSVSDITFENCTFERQISLQNIDSENIKFKSCTFNGNKTPQLQEFSCENFHFCGNTIKNDIYIKPRKIRKVFLEGSESLGLISFSYLNRSDIIDDFMIFTHQNHKTDYLVRNLSTKKIQIHGAVKDSSLILNKINIGTAVLDDFSNYGNFKITSLEALDENSNIILKNSYLGKAQISSSDFSKYRRIIISNTNIIEVIPVNVNWCYENINSESLAAKKEIFRQLKLINKKNEDIDTKLKFEKHEMHMFLKLSKQNKTSFSDKFILYTNFLSNNFGLSWLRALFILLSFSAICYTLIKFQLGQVYFSAELIADEIGYFLTFVNPIHLFDKVFQIAKDEHTNGAILIDSIAKLINAYLVFQLISAFRKYSRKS